MGEEEAIDWNRGRNVGRINKQEKKKEGKWGCELPEEWRFIGHEICCYVPVF